MELRDTPPHTPIPNQNGFAFNRDEGEVSSKRLISKGPQEERKSPGVKRTVVKLILENFQSAFNKKISQSFVDNIQLQPSSLLWRYFLLDYIICNFFIAPAVIAFWRGTWDYSLVWIKGIEYFNDNVCQDDQDNSLWGNLVCLAFGLILTQGAQATQFILKSRLDPEKTTFIAAARIYAVVWGFADIYLWKSIWDGINCLFGKNELTGTATMLIGMFGLQVGGALRSAASVPVGIVLDDEENMCTAHLYLKSTSKDKSLKIFGDLLLSLLIEILVIITWHGIWTLEDVAQHEVFGHSNAQTALVSLLVGYICCGIVYFLQFVIAIRLDRLQHQQRHPLQSVDDKLLCFVLNLVALVSTINSFRGYWYMMDEYYLTGNYVSSLLTGQLIGCLVLMALNATCSLHAGVIKEDKQDEPDSKLFDFFYSSYFYLEEKSRHHRLPNLSGLPEIYISNRDPAENPLSTSSQYLDESSRYH